MSENWQIGDLALCVAKAQKPISQVQPEVGRLYNVTDVYYAIGTLSNHLIQGISLDGLNPFEVRGYASHRFRKIHPLTDEERRQELADLPVHEEVRA